MGDHLGSCFGDDCVAMKRKSGVVVLAVVALCMLFSAVAFYVGHRVPIHMDSPDMVR